MRPDNDLNVHFSSGVAIKMIFFAEVWAPKEYSGVRQATDDELY